MKTRFLEGFLEGSVVIEGAWKVLRRQKHVLSQGTTPFACTLIIDTGQRSTGANIFAWFFQENRMDQGRGEKIDKKCPPASTDTRI